MVIDNKTQFEAVTKVANALPQLREASFTINGETSWLRNLTINNITIENACDILKEGYCSPNETCDSSDDTPSCKKTPVSSLQKSSLNLELVIGLSVGIPLFVIIVTVIAFLAYRRVKKRNATLRKTISDDNQSEISTIFSRRLPIFGMLRRHGMYKPDNLSETSNEDNKYEHYRTRTSDPGYSDSSPWTTRRLKESKRLGNSLYN
ncbi:hypothetical protein C0Q70_02873 [Pomacea canaliculata]|uniref:Uncharacterized protein n=2 Tax=Pomacea canaliculata TaxID=400727 RepID=A0A2T7PR53_POMCA|nr:hypothetical protein C0Q70_02873 [Pomacea canaliculata]